MKIKLKIDKKSKILKNKIYCIRLEIWNLIIFTKYKKSLQNAKKL